MKPFFDKAVVTPQGANLQKMSDLAFDRATTEPGKAILVLQRLEAAIKTALQEAVKARAETPPPTPSTTPPPLTPPKPPETPGPFGDL